MTLKKYKPYLKSIILPLAVGGLSAVFTMKGMPYYDMQEKPFFTPPDIVFPIVWTILYILMGISAACVKQSNDPRKKQALKTYYLQLAVNFFWSIIFFGLHQYFLAFLWLLLLILLVAKMIKDFAQIDLTAAKLQIPYLLWCIFAAALNFGVWWLNR
ncbi:MAG: tryptophan-rich sensory protein [Anaerotignum sp.]|nr:tryptophan-rich sensory protein [Anaerotignum sp.]